MADDLHGELDLSSPGVIDKYRAAAVIANDVINKLIAEAVAGKKVVQLCALGDQSIEAGVAAIYTEKKEVTSKGIGFPTCISINNVVGHFSPYKDDATVLKDGDIVKIDLGVQIDGFISQAATTVIVGSGETATTGKPADVICAAYYGAQIAHRLIKAGGKNTEVTEALAKVAAVFKCHPVEGVLTHQVKRYVIDGAQVVLNKATDDQQAEEFEFATGEVYAVDIVMSSGEGRTREGDARTTVYKRAMDVQYQLKMKAARALFTEANKRFNSMPFSLRSISDEKTARLGIGEMATHHLVDPLPVLYEKAGEYVAQIKFTVMLLGEGQERLSDFPPPFVSSEHSIDSAPELAAILAIDPYPVAAQEEAAAQ